MAVYTLVPDADMERFVASYGLGELLSCKGIAEGVENTNFLIKTAKGPFILTLYEKRVDLDDLPFFLELMEHLARAGLTCPTPVRDSEGRNLRQLMGRPAALITFLDGLSLHRPTPVHCQAVGAALAKLHLAGRDFDMRRSNALGLSGWRPLYQRFATRADEIAPGLGKMISDELAELDRLWPRRSSTEDAEQHENYLPGIETGVIHADLFPDNVFFRGDRLTGIIDFYFACNDAYAYDIAICLNAWCFSDAHQFELDKSRALLSGYRSRRELTQAELSALPTFARGAALRFLLTRAYDWLHRSSEALVSPKDPRDYMSRLAFHQSVSSLRDYGI